MPVVYEEFPRQSEMVKYFEWIMIWNGVSLPVEQELGGDSFYSSAWVGLWVMKIIYFYYIDTSVLLKNISLEKFIKTTSGTRAIYFP